MNVIKKILGQKSKKNSGKKLTLNRLLEFIKILIVNEYYYEKVKNNIRFRV